MPVSAETQSGFGLYVHWPFCAAKCPYCDFNSHVRRSVDDAAYGTALRQEMAHMHALTGRRTLDSVFFGGGTPSLMDPRVVEAVIEDAARLWGLRPDAEITLEANPTSTDAARFAAYRAAGVNRVSVGVQALNDADLKFLGRLHSVAEARAAVEVARTTFDRLSFDLIYARPGQTLGAWEVELRAALAMAADHLSLYQLTIEPGTPFEALHAKGAFQVPQDDLAADLYDLTGQVCAEIGLAPYEVSNYARPGAESRHNLIYWRYGDYVGLGPGAHGRITVAGEKHATETQRAPEAWRAQVTAQGHGLTSQERVPRDAQAEEMLMMGLRLAEGIEPARYASMAGRALSPRVLDDLEADGLITNEAGRLRVTAAGRPVLNGITGALLAPPPIPTPSR